MPIDRTLSVEQRVFGTAGTRCFRGGDDDDVHGTGSGMASYYSLHSVVRSQLSVCLCVCTS